MKENFKTTPSPQNCHQQRIDVREQFLTLKSSKNPENKIRIIVSSKLPFLKQTLSEHRSTFPGFKLYLRKIIRRIKLGKDFKFGLSKKNPLFISEYLSVPATRDTTAESSMISSKDSPKLTPFFNSEHVKENLLVEFENQNCLIESETINQGHDMLIEKCEEKPVAEELPIHEESNNLFQGNDQKITDMCYDPITNDVHYFITNDDKGSEPHLISRQKILMESPQTLIRFYEQYLEFPDEPQSYDLKY